MEQQHEVTKIYNLAIEKALDIFKERLVSTYLIGSLAHGGFSTVSSDIDIAFILKGGVKEEDWESIDEINSYIKQTKLAFSDKLSIFWTGQDVLTTRITSGAFPSPTKKDGLFPPFDILDLYQHGILIYGEDIKNNILVPNEDNIFIAGVEFLLSYVDDENRNKYLNDLNLFLKNETSNISKDILFPVRLLFTLLSGKIGSNDDASSFILNISDTTPQFKQLVVQAMSIRTNADFDIQTIKDNFYSLKDIYIYLIDVNIKKMREIKQMNYAIMLENWKERIIS